MNQHEPGDWRNIAHDEFETRKSFELQLSRAQNELAELKKTIEATNNYNAILNKKLAELESRSTVQDSRLEKTIDLLKKAKLLFTKHKQQITALKADKQNLHQELVKKSAMLDAEKLQHERTTQQLSQALQRLSTLVAMHSYTALTSAPHTEQDHSDIIYAHAAVDEADDQEDGNFVDQVLSFAKQFNK